MVQDDSGHRHFVSSGICNPFDLDVGNFKPRTFAVDLNTMLDEIENNMIVQALELSKGVKSKAANLLGLNRTTLIEKLKKKSIQ